MSTEGPAAGVAAERSGRWSAVVAFCLAGAATQMAWLTFAPVTTVAADRYGVSETAIGWLANVFALTFVPLAIPAGMLLDRYLRGTLIVGALITALGACLRLGGDTYAWMLLGSTIASLGQPLVLTGIAGLCRNYLRPKDRAVGIAVATASVWVGFVGAFLVGAAFSGADDLPALLRFHAGFAVVAAILLILALRSAPPFAHRVAAASAAESWASVKAVWGDSLVRRLCLFAFVPFGSFIALTTWTQSLLDDAGVSVDEVGVILTLCVAAGVVGTATIPVWAARHRREVAVGMAGSLVAAVALLVLALAPGFGTGLVVLGIAGLMLLPMLAIVLEMIERHGGEAEGVASGLVWTMGNLGGLVVTGLIGFTLGSPGLSFVLLAGVTLVGLPLLARIRGPVAARAQRAASESAAPAVTAATQDPENGRASV
ncbi:MFS transporter [Nocardioides sambongensis]|uniref:MFS transporter n=1 Tax=Nocardioides sambongensis TaxID=2589074 RepID=UPI001E47C29A|nr:MFS transporter [Nocardioides sambongensis]